MGPRGQLGLSLGGLLSAGGRLAPAALRVSGHTFAALAVIGSHFRGNFHAAAEAAAGVT